MKRTDVTYGQLDKVLRSLGFSCRLLTDDPPARWYEHKESGAVVTTPPFPMTDFVLDYHLVGARTIADLFGIADAKVFDAHLQKAARCQRRVATSRSPWAPSRNASWLAES